VIKCCIFVALMYYNDAYIIITQYKYFVKYISKII
jgi:hypothetical protein